MKTVSESKQRDDKAAGEKNYADQAKPNNQKYQTKPWASKQRHGDQGAMYKTGKSETTQCRSGTHADGKQHNRDNLSTAPNSVKSGLRPSYPTLNFPPQFEKLDVDCCHRRATRTRSKLVPRMQIHIRHAEFQEELNDKFFTMNLLQFMTKKNEGHLWGFSSKMDIWSVVCGC